MHTGAAMLLDMLAALPPHYTSFTAPSQPHLLIARLAVSIKQYYSVPTKHLSTYKASRYL